MKFGMAVDFDDTICMYGGWQGEAICSSPFPGTKEFLETLSGKFRIGIEY